MDDESKKRLEKKVEHETKLSRITVRTALGTVPFPSTYVKTLYATGNPTGSTTVDDITRFTDPPSTTVGAPEGMSYDPTTAKYIADLTAPWRKPLTPEDLRKAEGEFKKMHGISIDEDLKTKPKMYRVPKTMILDSHEKVMKLVGREGNRYDAVATRHGFIYVLRCARHFEMLAWCGYIGIDNRHPCYKLSTEKIKKKYGLDLEAHGGITYTGLGIPTGEQGEQTDKDLWVFGFDTLHAFDYAPGIHQTLKKIKRKGALGADKSADYKNVEFVQQEVQSMLQQLDKMIHVEKLTDDKKKSIAESIKLTHRVEGITRLSTVRADAIEEAPFDLTRTTVTGTKRFRYDDFKPKDD